MYIDFQKSLDWISIVEFNFLTKTILLMAKEIIRNDLYNFENFEIFDNVYEAITT